MLAKVKDGENAKESQDWYNDTLVLDYTWVNYTNITKALNYDNQSILKEDTFYECCILFKK